MIEWIQAPGGALDLAWNGRPLLYGLHPVLHLETGGVTPAAATVDGASVRYTFAERIELTLTAESGDTGAFLSVKLDMESSPFRMLRLDVDAGLELRMTGLANADRWMGLAPFCSWWTEPVWAARVQALPAHTLALVGDCGADCVCCLPLPGASVFSELEGTPDGCALRLASRCAGTAHLNGCVLAISAAPSPYDAVAQTFRAAHDAGKIAVPLRADRPLPEMFRYFGWCTWNAFYHDVTDAGMTEKLAEFREKDLPVRWVLIDDGWSPTENDRLAGFGANPEKFPNGLRGFTARAKSEYGVDWVGVWHAFMGYWRGVSPDSAIAAQYRDHLTTLNSEVLLPGPTADDAFAFYDAWHESLANDGVDFVKIDAQGCLKDYLHGERPAVPAAAEMHRGIERSVARHFDGRMINCMGVTQENFFARPQTALTRNSDDFFPDRPDSFRTHLMQNAYTAVFQHNLYACDWDMWWSQHHSAKRSAVLRAISGGPIYVSDKVGETDAAMIRPLIEADGRLLMCDDAAMPTRDCLFRCPTDGGAVKLFNRAGDAGVVAVFNITMDKQPVTAEIRLTDVEWLNFNKEYIAFSYFSHKFYRVSRDTVLHCTLGYEDAETFCFYPIQDGKIMIGDISKYISAASAEKTAVSVNSLTISPVE